MTGPPPKEGEKLGRYDSPLDAPLDTLQAQLGAPAPPLRGRTKYLAPTLEWWERWTRGAQAKLFVETDWSRLQMIAPLVERYYRMCAITEMDYEPDYTSEEGARHAEAHEKRVVTALNTMTKLMAEIRQNEALLGATHLDRLRGRIKLEKPEDKPSDEEDLPENVKIMNDYKKRLIG